MTRKFNRANPTVENLSDFLSEIEKILLRWSPSRDYYPWFRGINDATYPLVPRIYRAECRSLEEDYLRDDFKMRAWPYLSEAVREPNTEWEWYFLMQHHGLPTRLLDWTESALVALYFALRDGDNKKNAAVWVLDPFALNQKVARKNDKIFTPTDREIQAYLPKPSSNALPPRYPIAIVAPFHSRRIAAQRGVFTLHGHSHKVLEKYAGLRNRLIKIEISHTVIQEMKEQVSIAGITETTVFPELPALCLELFQYWKYEPPH